MSFSGIEIFTSGKVSNIECRQKVKLFEMGYKLGQIGFVEMIVAFLKSTDGRSEFPEICDRRRNFPYHSIGYHSNLFVIYSEWSIFFDSQGHQLPSTGRIRDNVGLLSFSGGIYHLLAVTVFVMTDRKYRHGPTCIQNRQFTFVKPQPNASERLDCRRIASRIAIHIPTRSSVGLPEVLPTGTFDVYIQMRIHAPLN
jgi:hypothetical protein